MDSISLSKFRLFPKSVHFSHWGSAITEDEFKILLYSTVKSIQEGRDLNTEFNTLKEQIDWSMGDGPTLMFFNVEEMAQFFEDLMDGNY